MKKLFTIILLVLLCANAMAYDFAAVCSTGQMLYYNITSDVEPYTVEVTYERGDASYYIAPVGNIEIPSSVNDNGITYSVTNIKEFAFYNCQDITSITIPNSVTNIGYNAFSECKGLSSIALGSSLESIGDNAFEGCYNLTSITIPNSVTSIGTFAFKNCRLLTEVTIGSSVTNIGGDAFDLCNSLTTVNYNAIHCTAAYSPFNRCSALSSIYIDENVTNIPASIFTQCRNLRIYFNGDIEQWCTMIFSEGNANIEWIDNGYDLYIGGDPVYDLVIPETITEINVHAFRCAKNITSLTIPSSVTSIGYYAFNGCSGLTTINFNATNCSYMGSSTEPVLAIFKGCSSLEYLNIGENVTNIPDLAFYGCNGLTSVTIPSSVTNIGENAFFEVRNIEYSGNATGSPWGALTVNGFVDGHLVYYDDTQTVLTGCGALATEITIPNSVTNIGENAFSECKAISSISIPSSVTSIGNNAFKNVRNIIYDGTATGSPWGALTINGLTDGYLVYSDDTRTQITGCNSLADVITIPSSVTNINNGAFSGCNNLTSVNFNATNCNNANSVFGECEAFTILNIGDNVTKIPDGMFSYCMGLTSVIIPNSVDSIGINAFGSCNSLSTLTIGNSVTSIGGSAFSNCSGLYEITIPESVTYIGESAFMECGSLTTVNFNAIDCNADNTLFPECTSLININIGNNVTKIPNGAFIECNITDIILPNSLENIGDNAFAYCRHLTEINIPNSVISIGQRAFEGCEALSELSIGESVSNIGNLAFYGCSNLSIINFNAINCISMGTQEEPVFSQQSYLQNINIGNRVTIIPDFAFKGCSISNLTIPDSVSIIGESAFEYCDFSSLTIGKNVTSIGNYAFFNGGIFSLNYNATNCTLIGENNGITGNTNTYELIIGENVETIPGGLFRGCTGLTEITIPNSVTSIGENTFYGCSELTAITIGSSTENIGGSAFNDCDNITDINIFAEIPPSLDNNVFTETTHNSATLWVPCGIVDDYMNDIGWGRFVDIRNDTSTYVTVNMESSDQNMGSVTGDGEYSCGTDVTINAIPNYGFRFLSWNDGNTDNPRTITVTSDSTFVAMFAEQVQQFTITVLSSNEAYGSVSGSGTYYDGDTVAILAMPNSGYSFVSWNDGDESSPRTIVVTSDSTFIADFAKCEITQTIDTVVPNFVTVGDHTFYSTGNYSFAVLNETACDTIFDIRLRVLAEPVYDIGPNPAKSLLNINSDGFISAVEFYTTTGQLVMRKEVNGYEAEFDVEGLVDGVYILRIYGEESSLPSISKIIKE